MRLHRLVLLAGAPLALAALLGSAAPAHAGWNNTIMTNGRPIKPSPVTLSNPTPLPPPVRRSTT